MRSLSSNKIYIFHWLKSIHLLGDRLIAAIFTPTFALSYAPAQERAMHLVFKPHEACARYMSRNSYQCPPLNFLLSLFVSSEIDQQKTWTIPPVLNGY